MNPCPGILIDTSIVTNKYYEFYLNAHTAIQGTSKPCIYIYIIYYNTILKIKLRN